MRLQIRLPLVLCTILAVAPLTASAQIEAGQVIDDSLHVPLAHITVSLHRLAGASWQLVDSATTDERGLFQFRPTEPGVFRVGVLGTSSPQFAGGVDTLTADSVNERMLLVPLLRRMQTRPYLEFEVEKPAAVFDPTRTPAYPPELRAQGAEGEVDAQFVVDANGAVDLESFKVLRPSDPKFVDAVRKFLISAHYYPATIGGRVVRQVVQQQFTFNLH